MRDFLCLPPCRDGGLGLLQLFRADASAFSASVFFRWAASSSSRFSCAFRSVASRRSAAGSIRRVVADVSADPIMEAAATLSRVRGALKRGKHMKDVDKINKEKIKIRDGGAYTETSVGFFTSLRKRLAFAAASSRLVAAAAPLNFFDRPPSVLSPARRFFAPP